MNALGIVEGDILSPVCLEDSLGLSTEDDLLDGAHVLLVLLESLELQLCDLLGVLVLEAVIEDGLLFVALSSIVTALHELLD
jgi:hypothetical protein